MLTQKRQGRQGFPLRPVRLCVRRRNLAPGRQEKHKARRQPVDCGAPGELRGLMTENLLEERFLIQRILPRAVPLHRIQRPFAG